MSSSSVQLLNIESISPNGAGQIVIPSDLNLTGASPVYRINGVPLSMGQNQTPWLSDIDAAGYRLLNAGHIGIKADANGLIGSLGVSQFTIAGATNPNQTLWIGFDTSNNVGVIQPGISGYSWNSLILNPVGGNVGIGTASPAYPLDVNGDVNVTGTYRINGVPLSFGGNPAGANTQIQYNNNGAFGASANLAWDDASARLNLSAGVGVFPGVYIIHPIYSRSGSMYVDNGGFKIDAGANTAFYLTSPSLVRVSSGSNQVFIANTPTGTAFQFSTASGATLAILPNGDVGIKTLTPASALHVHATTSAFTTGQIRISNPASPSACGFMFYLDELNTFYLLITDAGNPFGSFNSLRPFSVDTSNGRVTLGNGLALGGIPQDPSGQPPGTVWWDVGNNVLRLA